MTIYNCELYVYILSLVLLSLRLYIYCLILQTRTWYIEDFWSMLQTCVVLGFK